MSSKVSFGELENVAISGYGIVLNGVHAITMLRGRGGYEGCNVDSSFPKETECGKVQVVGWVIATRESGFVLLRKEASLMDGVNAYVGYVIVGNWMLGEVGKCCSLE
jgi:hypothetical protein